MPNQSREFEEPRVIPYIFDDEEINSALAELNRISCATMLRYSRQSLALKILLILAGLIFTIGLEYAMFTSLWYREPIFKFVMIFTPALAGGVGYLLSDIIDRTFDLKYGLFHHEFQFAYENKFFYEFEGTFRAVYREEKNWTDILVGEGIWRVRNKVQDLQAFEGQEVRLLLTRNFFDDAITFECVYVKALKRRASQ